FFRKLFRRGRGKETTIAERPAEVAGAYAPAAAEPAMARRGPRRGLLLALLVVLAGAAVAGLFAWRAGWLTSDLGPRQPLRRRRPPRASRWSSGRSRSGRTWSASSSS